MRCRINFAKPCKQSPLKFETLRNGQLALKRMGQNTKTRLYQSKCALPIPAHTPPLNLWIRLPLSRKIAGSICEIGTVRMCKS